LAQLFRENGIDYEKVNYYTEPLTKEKLRDLIGKTGLQVFDLVRVKEPLVQELYISSETDSEKLIRLMVENPALLQRPIVEVGDEAVIARPIEKAIELLRRSEIL